MAIKTTSDLDQEIALLEQEELIKRNMLMRNIITPGAALNTTGTLFMSWVRAGKNQSGTESHINLFKLFTKLILPLTVVGTMLKQSGYIFKSIGFALSELVPQLFNKDFGKSLWAFFKTFGRPE